MMRIGLRAAMAVLAMGLLPCGNARAGIENAGTTAANFLTLGAGARSLGMAGASLGLGDDTGGAAWNAAALGWVNGSEGVLSHAGLYGGSLQEWGALGGRMGRTRTRWALTGMYQGDGTIAGVDASGVSTGSFSVSSMAFGATLAQQFGGRATIGLGAKAVRENIATVSGSGLAFDAGVMLRAGRFGLGAAAQNVGGRMSYGTSTYPFPTSYGVGLGFSHPPSGVRIGVDVNFPSAYYNDVRAGAEWQYRGALALRAGYRYELGADSDPLTGPSFGVGARHGGMWLDYGYLLPSGGSGQHRLGLRFSLGGSDAGDLAAGTAGPSGKPGDPGWAREGTRLGPAKPAKR